MTAIDFVHNQSSHCESGVTANMLSHHGLKLSEAMAFGIGTGLFFAYLPFVRVNKLPLTTYRCESGGIFKRVAKRLGCNVETRKFSDPEQSMRALDDKLDAGIPVGCRTSAYWLPYFPPAYRFHFNAHNLVVIGRDKDSYLISDPVFPEIERCPRDALMKARYGQGALAPKGAMFSMTHVPGASDMTTAIAKGIKEVCRRMLGTPLPIAGVRGIRFLAKRLEKWPHKLGERNAILHVGQLIRMQEEIGTGGAGFRFMYAAFLQEAAEVLENSRLIELSEEMTSTGDLWRKSAVIGARICKGRASAGESYAAMADLLRECAGREALVYKALMKTI